MSEQNNKKGVLMEVLRKAEIKRVAENLTKKELCNIFNINYNFYMNCVSDRNVPSQIMIDALREYLEMPTETVYKMVFAQRSTDDFVKNKDKAKFFCDGGVWKEAFHDKLEISQDYYKQILGRLSQEGVVSEPSKVLGLE